MDVHVVDASALGAMVFGEPEAQKIADRLAGSLLIGPELLPFELASICLKKIKAHPAKKDLIMRAFDTSAELAIEYVEVDHHHVVALAEEAGLTTYDAAYLWLAQHTGAQLVTLDAKLRKAATKKSKRRLSNE